MDKPDFTARIGAQTITARTGRQEFRVQAQSTQSMTAAMGAAVTLTARIGPQEFLVSGDYTWQPLPREN